MGKNLPTTPIGVSELTAMVPTLKRLAIVAAMIVVVLSVSGRRLKLLEFRPGGSDFAWSKEELLEASQSDRLVVWVNPVPWVAEPAEGADNWGGYATERRELAEFIAESDIANLIMVSGDAHLVAIDDGSNTNYSSEPGRAFPLLHAAALDRPGGHQGWPVLRGAPCGRGAVRRPRGDRRRRRDGAGPPSPRLGRRGAARAPGSRGRPRRLDSASGASK